jgi:hypothetical protein
MIETLRGYAGLGFTRAIGSIRGVESLQAIEALGRDVIPVIEPF